MTYNPNFAGNATVPASTALRAPETNSTGSTLTQLTPVKITNTGDLGLINVSTESDVQAIAGIVDSDILNSASGNVVNTGRILNITTAAGFGSQFYISK